MSHPSQAGTGEGSPGGGHPRRAVSRAGEGEDQMRVRPLVSVGMCLGAVVATLAAGLGTPAGAVTTDQSYWVPVGKQVVVRGHGYGHGHGMSQYGAEGAALQG